MARLADEPAIQYNRPKLRRPGPPRPAHGFKLASDSLVVPTRADYSPGQQLRVNLEAQHSPRDGHILTTSVRPLVAVDSLQAPVLVSAYEFGVNAVFV